MSKRAVRVWVFLGAAVVVALAAIRTGITSVSIACSAPPPNEHVCIAGVSLPTPVFTAGLLVALVVGVVVVHVIARAVEGPRPSAPLTLYENLPGVPYWYAWPVLAVAVVGAGQVLVTAFNENSYTITMFLFACAGIIIPVGSTYLAYAFAAVVRRLSPVLWNGDDAAMDSWLSEHLDYVFSLNSRQAKLVILAVVLTGLATVFWVGLPFNTPLLNVLSLVGFAFLLFLCGHGAHMVIALLKSLHQLSELPVTVAFYQLPHPAISGLQRLYSVVTSGVVVGYVSLLVAIAFGPYGFNGAMLAWTTLASVFPIATLVSSVLSVHGLIRRAKQGHLEDIGTHMAALLPKARHSADAMDKLSKLADLKDRVQALPEWPVVLSSSVALALALLTVLTQIVIALVRAGPPPA